MLLVIYGHCHYYTITSAFGGIEHVVSPDAYSLTTRLLKRLSSFVYSFHMPFFMMLSGICFRFTIKKDKGFSYFVHGKYLRLVLPFVLVTTFLSVPCKYVSGYWDGSVSVINDIVCGQYLLMGNSHLWFIASLFWIFLLSYFVVKWNPNSEKSKTFEIMVLAVGLNLLSEFFNYNYLGLPNAMQYFLYFISGYLALPFFNRFHRIPYIYFFLLFLILLLFQSIREHFVRQYDDCLFVQIMNSLFFIVGAISASSLCAFFCKEITNYRWTKWLKKLFAKNTYEFYLYSDPFNYILIYWGWSIWEEETMTSNTISILMFLIRFLGTILFAYIIIVIVNKSHVKDLKVLL